VANTVEELINAIAKIRDSFGYDKPVLVEEFLTGKEITVGIIGNPAGSIHGASYYRRRFFPRSRLSSQNMRL